MHPNLITPDILAERWNIKRSTLNQWRWNGRGPKFLKLGRQIVYRIQDVEEFENENVRQYTSEEKRN